MPLMFLTDSVMDAEGDEKKIDKVFKKFEGHCEPRKNVNYELQFLFKSPGEW